MSEISKEIGQNIRRTRKMRKITHQQLAQAIGKSQSAISKYESGEIAVDIDTLYAIADALQVHIETLLYFPNTATSSSTLKECPAFFRNVKNLYGYVYDGRINRIGRRLFELHPEENGLTKVMMYMNFEDYDHYQNCENTYKGYMEHFDAVTNITLQNRDVEMETAYIQMMLGSKGILTPLIPNCYVLCTLAILKTFVIRSFFFKKWLLTHVFGGSQVQKSSCKQACIGFMTF